MTIVTSESIAAVRSELRSDDWMTRSAGIHKIARDAARYVELLPELYEIVRNDNPPPSSYAWSAFGRYGEEAVPFLLELSKAEDAVDRRYAIDLLMGLQYHPARPIIGEQVLPDRPTSWPSWGGSKLLVVETLRCRLGDPDIGVSATAAWALDEIGEASEQIFERLIGGLRSTNPRVAGYSALALGRIGDPGALTALEDFLRSSARVSEAGQTVRPLRAAAQSIERIRRKQS